MIRVAKRRRLMRTAVLGVLACVALFWGAVDLVGVSPQALLQDLLAVVVVLVLVLLAAMFTGWLLARWRRR